jgi:hypothetical protein
LPFSRGSFLSPAGGFASPTLAPDWLVEDALEFRATPARANADGIVIASGKAKSARLLMEGPIALVVEFGEIDPTQ